MFTCAQNDGYILAIEIYMKFHIDIGDGHVDIE